MAPGRRIIRIRVAAGWGSASTEPRTGHHAGQQVRQRPGKEQAHRHPELFAGIRSGRERSKRLTPLTGPLSWTRPNDVGPL